MSDTERLDRIAVLEMAHKALTIKLKFYNKKIGRMAELATDASILCYNEREIIMAKYRLYKYEKLKEVALRRLELVEQDIEALEEMDILGE